MRAVARHAFISHASADAELAVRICEGLEARGLQCWIAPRDVQPQGTYGSEIVRGLREAEVFLVIVTDAAAESQQVEREAERASHYKKRIIPLIVGKSDPGPRLEFYVAGRQHFPCSGSPDDRFLDALAGAIRGVAVVPPSAPRPSRGNKRLLAIGAGVLAIALAYVIPTYFKADPLEAPLRNPNPSGDGGSGQASTPVDDALRSRDATVDPKPDTAKPAEPLAPAPAPVSPPVRPPAKSGKVDVATPPPPPDATSTRELVATLSGARLTFVAIPGGTFGMGCSAGDERCADDERPIRKVAVDPYQMSTTEVTQQVWEAVMGSNPSDFVGGPRPVERVSWQDAQDFIERLNQRRDGFVYRLPTEAEWEYAVRANQPPPADPSPFAWFGMADGTARSPRPQTVAAKRANGWGLYDMLGNVAEWCEDWYSPNYQRVVRGGSWLDSAQSLRVSARGKAVPTTKDYSIGLRLVRTPQ
jgi:formylglycine-generating enzyme required for sulfatase activity